jgi:hypothetical protein
MPATAIRAEAIVMSTISKTATANRIETAVSRLTVAPWRDGMATRTLNHPARSEAPIEIDRAIEAGFMAPSMTDLL